jgi:hypothetical protein
MTDLVARVDALLAENRALRLALAERDEAVRARMSWEGVQPHVLLQQATELHAELDAEEVPETTYESEEEYEDVE